MNGTQPPVRRLVLAASLATTIALSGCGQADSPGSAGSIPSASTPSASTPASPSSPTTPASGAPSSGGQLSGIPIYWLGETAKAFRLFREFRTVPDVGGTVASAVAAMTRLTPLDPDYSTPWKPASRVAVTRAGSALTVDLSADALSGTNVGSEVAARAVQQLVYTATAAAAQAGTPATTVRITIDGSPADAWGAVSVGEPVTRMPMAMVQSHAWVTSPQHGATVPMGSVAFKGFGTSFEANFLWRVTNSAGEVVASGHAMGGTGTGGFGGFTFTVTLPAGTYTVEVATDDASGGAEGSGPHSDTKGFTVA